ncbi:MAG TPA: transglycosylase SLT domain-containing protein [Vicinamibacterales bacterium]|nr:transglycosylase SLT domain-containing protein [Vicinamibacterales bacterium]
MPAVDRVCRAVRIALASVMLALISATAGLGQSVPPAAGVPSPTDPQQTPEPQQPLQPTVHVALPQNVEDYWFAPRASDRAPARSSTLANAATAYASGNYLSALMSAQQARATAGPLEAYAQFYVGLSQLRLSNGNEAAKAFDSVLARKPEGYLSLGVMLGKAEAAELRGDHAATADIYEQLSTHKTVTPEDVLLRLGRASLAAGNRSRAAEAFVRVYYEFPLSEAATSAGAALPPLQDLITKKDAKLDLGRALMLFGAKRYNEARTAFQDLQKQVSGDDREVVDLRIAESDYFLKRYAATRDEVRPFLDQASRKAEAKFFYLSALRGLGDADQAADLTRALVKEFPDSSWAGEALNNLGTHLILTNQDDQAAQTFRELFEKFPSGANAERSAWKYGWWAYTTGNYAETARVFESAAAAFPRSDYRPPYLYWAARAREKMGERETSQARMRLVYTDYFNSYYGRLASRRLPPSNAEAAAVVPASVRAPQPQASVPDPPTAPLIRQLLIAGLYDDGLNELRFAQKAWGTTPAIEATIAWVHHEKGDLRRAITLMRRAYPQFLAAGGEGLPADILQVIFPLTYWDAIKRNSALHGLDPYIVAALIAQESTFDPSAHSGANAWGLMQILPSTGKRLAASVGIRRFNTSLLLNGDTNVRLGTLYFKRLIEQFGGTYYALASYNAGENRVVRWKAERPGMDEDEFIDDIPFPETQNYVKRILGTAEDYRHLYGESGARPSAPRPARATSAKPTTKASAAKGKKTAPVKKKASVKKHRRK